MFKERIWELFEFLSPEAKLYINGKDRYTTKFAVLMSLLTFLSIISLAGYFVAQFWMKIDFNAVISKEKDPAYLVEVNDFPLLIKLVDVNNKPMNSKLTSIAVKLWQGKDNLNKPINLKLEQCNLEHHINETKRYLYEKINITQFLCIKRDNINLTLYQTSSGAYSYFNIYLKECVNSTENGNCLPKNDIVNQLRNSNYYLEYYFFSFGVNHKNYLEPLTQNLFYKRQKIFYEFYYVYYDYFKKIIYRTDNGNLFEDFYIYDGIQYDSASSYSELRPTGANISVEVGTYHIFKIIVNSNELDNYQRTFPKFQNLTANIGGVMDFCLIIAELITKFFTSPLLDLELINIFFHFPNKKENKRIVMVGSNSKNYSKFGFSDAPFNSNSKKLPVNNYLNISDKLYVDKTNSQKISFTNYDLLKTYFCKQNKQNYEKCVEVIRRKLSSDYLLEIFNQFEKLKNITLNQNQKVVFNYIRNFKFEENLQSLEAIRDPKHDFDISFNLIKNQQGLLDKKILNCFYE